jgi:hypothetical protein
LLLASGFAAYEAASDRRRKFGDFRTGLADAAPFNVAQNALRHPLPRPTVAHPRTLWHLYPPMQDYFLVPADQLDLTSRL